MKKFLPLIILAILFILPLLGLSSYGMHILVLVIMWSIIGMAWNLLGGYCGQVSFGHAAFFGMGAYTAGLFYYQYTLVLFYIHLAFQLNFSLKLHEYELDEIFFVS